MDNINPVDAVKLRGLMHEMDESRSKIISTDWNEQILMS